MKFSSKALSFLALVSRGTFAQELPITTSDVFIQSGELTSSSIIIMSRCNNEAESSASLLVDGASMVDDQMSTIDTDFTNSFKLEGLNSSSSHTYTVTCTPKDGSSAVTSTEGSFKTLPDKDTSEPLSFVWAADLAGQGWGRNPDFEITNVDGEKVKGGYVVFNEMSKLKPNFALFQGDMIYADNSIPPEKPVPEAIHDMGSETWINNPSKDFVAVTLDEFRANWKYNFGDEHMANFLAKTPVYVQWDDHEVTNNWYPSEILGAPLYKEGEEADIMAQNSLKAFYEYNPMMDQQLIYRNYRAGKHIEFFFLDLRSYRDINPLGNSTDPKTIFGREQLDWLKTSLKESTATWKVISNHDPIAIVTGGTGDWDSFSQGQPEILGREFELKELFSFIKENDIKNIVSLTSDVHFAAAVEYSPENAEGGFVDFNPFKEFVIGPIHAGAFGPGNIDTSFGAAYKYVKGPNSEGYDYGAGANLPPLKSDFQSFGHASVSESGDLRIKLVGVKGDTMYEATLVPETVEEKEEESSASEKEEESSASSSVLSSGVLSLAAVGGMLSSFF